MNTECPDCCGCVFTLERQVADLKRERDEWKARYSQWSDVDVDRMSKMVLITSRDAAIEERDEARDNLARSARENEHWRSSMQYVSDLFNATGEKQPIGPANLRFMGAGAKGELDAAVTQIRIKEDTARSWEQAHDHARAKALEEAAQKMLCEHCYSGCEACEPVRAEMRAPSTLPSDLVVVRREDAWHCEVLTREEEKRCFDDDRIGHATECRNRATRLRAALDKETP